MTNPADPTTLPGVYVRELLSLAARFGADPERLIDGLGIDVAALDKPATRVHVAAFAKAVRRAYEQTGEPGLGFCMGMQMRISSHGFLGFAAMTAPTVRGAIALAERYVATRTPALGFRLYVEGETASLVLVENEPLGDLREFVVSALFVGLAHIAVQVTGRDVQGSADVSFPEPSHYARFAHLIPGPVRFERPSNRLVFQASLLDVPLVNADAVALSLAREQCERELDALGDPRIVSRVREAMPLEDAGFRSLEEVAKRLHVSPRTLKRQLAAANTTYSDLLDDVRRERALVLLEQRDNTVELVAEKLGYSDVANFTRAFKRWTGTTPGAIRRK